MKEKCSDIDTSSKNIEENSEIKNYHDLDIESLEKEFEKTKNEYEKKQLEHKELFKKVKISNDNINSKIENDYEKSHQTSVYDISEPIYKSYFGVIIAIIIIILCIIGIIVFITSHFSNIKPDNTQNAKVDENVDFKYDRIIWKNNVFQILHQFHNFTKDEISKLKVENLTEQLYVDLCLQGILLNKNKFKLSKKPKISIIKPIFHSFNSLYYLNYSLRSIQNQNLADIEIIVIDDASNDNNEMVNLVKKFQEEDPRIKLLINEKERGLFYTICKGILNSKGKYIMELDGDDLFTYGTLFSELYNEAENNNLDIISFWGTREKNRYKIIKDNYENVKIGEIIEDELSRIKLSYRLKVGFFQENGMIWNKFVKREVFQNSVKKIGEKNYGKYIFTHEDSILVFMMYREAKRVKEYRRFGHLKFLHDESISSPKTLKKNKDQYCYEYLTYFDFILEYSGNDKDDKYYAAKDFVTRYQDMKSMIGPKNKELAVNVAHKYLNCKYIPLSLINDIKAIYYEILNKKVD